MGEQAWLDTLNVDYWAEHCPQLTAKRPRIEEEEEEDPDEAQRSASPVSPQLTAKRPRIEEEEEDPDDAQRSASPVSPALYITSPPSPPSSSGPTSTGEWFRFLRFLFISLKHAAFSALHPSMPTRPRVFHPHSTTLHLLCLWLIPLSVRITL